jgi:hypothetical protein
VTGDDGQDGPRGSQAFVIRLQRTSGDLRGQVVAVATGASRLFKDLPEAMAFIEEIVEAERRGNPEGV